MTFPGLFSLFTENGVAVFERDHQAQGHCSALFHCHDRIINEETTLPSIKFHAEMLDLIEGLGDEKVDQATILVHLSTPAEEADSIVVIGVFVEPELNFRENRGGYSSFDIQTKLEPDFLNYFK